MKPTSISFVVRLLYLFIGISLAVYVPVSNPEPKGRVPIFKSEQDKVYYANLEVGTPPQIQRMIINIELDFSVFMEAKSCPPNMVCLNVSQSTTYHTQGEVFEDFCLLSEDFIGFQNLSYSSMFPYCLSKYDPSFFGKFYGVDGFLGMGYQGKNTEKLFDPWTELFPPYWPQVYALQFQTWENGINELQLGGYDNGDALLWSEKQLNRAVTLTQIIEFPMFHIQMCGEKLLKTSAFVSAQVVSIHYCLGLPKSLFNMVLVWLGGFCEYSPEPTDNTVTGEIVCTFDSPEQIRDLPSLSFQMSEDSERIEIYLSNLASEIITQNSGSAVKYLTTLCVIRGDRYSHHPDSKIILGLQVLESFYTVVDLERNRVGIAPANLTKPSESYSQICPKKPTCIGGQTYDPTVNACKDPQCSLYYFQYPDEETKECRVHKWFYIVVGVIVGIVSLFEIGVIETQIRLERKAFQPPNTNPNS